jgi:hypothetical protein
LQRIKKGPGGEWRRRLGEKLGFAEIDLVWLGEGIIGRSRWGAHSVAMEHASCVILSETRQEGVGNESVSALER